MASVSELITLSDMRAPDEKFDHIIIETSGVSNPRAIRTQFQDAAYYNMPLMERVRLDTMVTLIDATTFLDYLGSSKDATEDHSPELFFRSEEERLAEEEARKSRDSSRSKGRAQAKTQQGRINAMTKMLHDYRKKVKQRQSME